MKELLIFIGGALIGATAAALLTPYQGKELRERVKNMLIEKGIASAENVEEYVERIILKIEEE